MEHTARVGLGPIDRIALVGAWLVSCAVVYGLGFYTGSHTQERLRGDEERIVRLPVAGQPPPPGQRERAADDLTFWGALEPGGQRAKPGEGIPSGRPPATGSATPAAGSLDKPGTPPARPGQGSRPSSTAGTRKAGPTASPGQAPTHARKAAAATNTTRPVATGPPTSAGEGATTASRPKPAPPEARPRSLASRRAPASAGAEQTRRPAPTPAAAARTTVAPSTRPRATGPAATDARPAPRASRARAADGRSVVTSD
jgi:hypothetical protein